MEDRVYKQDYLADTLDINIKTINNWIAAGWFRDVDWENHEEQIRIPASALFLLITGEEVAIQKVIDHYLEKQKKEVNSNEMNEEAYNIVRRTIEVSDLITFYEERYNWTYEVVVKEKGNPNTTECWRWGREGKEWRNLLREIRELKF